MPRKKYGDAEPKPCRHLSRNRGKLEEEPVETNPRLIRSVSRAESCGNYISTNDTLPPGGLPAWVQENLVYINNGDFSAHARLLPFLEQSPLYNAANFNVAAYNSTVGDLINHTIHTTRLTLSSARRARHRAG